MPSTIIMGTRGTPAEHARNGRGRVESQRQDSGQVASVRPWTSPQSHSCRRSRRVMVMSDSPAMSCVRRRLLELKSTASMPENLSGGDGSGDENRE